MEGHRWILLDGKSVNALYICPHKEHKMFGPVRDECIMSKRVRRCLLLLPLLQEPRRAL